MAVFSIRFPHGALVFLLGLFIVCFASAAATNTTSDGQDSLPLDDVQRFSTAIGQIKNFYVNPVEDSELFEFSTQHFEDDSYRAVKGD